MTIIDYFHFYQSEIVFGNRDETGRLYVIIALNLFYLSAARDPRAEPLDLLSLKVNPINGANTEFQLISGAIARSRYWSDWLQISLERSTMCLLEGNYSIKIHKYLYMFFN